MTNNIGTEVVEMLLLLKEKKLIFSITLIEFLILFIYWNIPCMYEYGSLGKFEGEINEDINVLS